MERSLTVLLPAHNVESTLAADVTHALDVVSDLTGRFELVIVDDGSADATSEVIDELTRFYPQVRSVRHRRHRGRNEAIRTGLKHSTGEMIFLPDTGGTRKKGAYHMLDRETVELVAGKENWRLGEIRTRFNRFPKAFWKKVECLAVWAAKAQHLEDPRRVLPVYHPAAYDYEPEKYPDLVAQYKKRQLDLPFGD